jgi:MoxR-like ATPase
MALGEDLRDRLSSVGYLADDATATIADLAGVLDKPLLLEGPAGTGKTQLAKSLAEALGMPLIRLQCYEGIDEAKAVYEWDYRRQLLRIQADAKVESAGEWSRVEQDIFSDEFLLARPLLQAIRSEDPVVLLVDEVDRLEPEMEALLLELLGEMQITIPELGTVRARSRPRVILTSNGSRELSEALRRRCLYLYLDYPDAEREAEILRESVAEATERLCRSVAEAIALVRSWKVGKLPSIAESIDWTRALTAMSIAEVDDEVLSGTLNLILKDRDDIETARAMIASR